MIDKMLSMRGRADAEVTQEVLYGDVQALVTAVDAGPDLGFAAHARAEGNLRYCLLHAAGKPAPGGREPQTRDLRLWVPEILSSAPELGLSAPGLVSGERQRGGLRLRHDQLS
jgi:hypothetical protein